MPGGSACACLRHGGVWAHQGPELVNEFSESLDGQVLPRAGSLTWSDSINQGVGMSTEPLETAIASTRSVLVGVTKSQLSDATPCSEWSVSQLINHIVGGQYFFASAVKGENVDG